MKANYYRDTIYLWMALYFIPLLGSVVVGLMMTWGGDESHFAYFLNGALDGNPHSKMHLKDLFPLFLVFSGMSFVMQFMFKQEREKIMPESFKAQLVGNFMIMTLDFVLILLILQFTPLEEKDEIPYFNEIIICAVSWVCLAISTFIFTIIHGLRQLLPAAKNLDLQNSKY